MGKTRLKQAMAILLALAGLLAVGEPVSARVRMSFMPGRHGYTVAHQHRGYGHHFAYGRGRRRSYAPNGRASRSRSGPDEAPAPAAPPGSGFKMEDGVLTYPAPARFQPQNLKHP